MKNYLSNWNFIRVTRLVLGVVITIQGILEDEWMLTVFGGLFTLMSLFNFGCCGTAGCSTKYGSGQTAKTKDITYEEVK